MTDRRSHEGTRPPTIRERRGLRITLLALATAILLCGAAAAGVYGYVAITAG